MVGNLEYYKVFYYTAKCGSVTGAASVLSITQPAVSQALKQLEKQIKVTLFTRVPKGIKLTAEGEVLYEYVAKGYEQIALGVEKIQKMQNLELGEVRIGASDMTLEFYLLPFLERFYERYPDIKIIVTNGPTPETLESLSEGKIDFGVVSTPFDRKQGLVVTPVREIEDVFVAGRKYISYKNRMIDFHELETLPMVFLEKNTSTRKYMDEILMENQVEIVPEFELATSDMIVQFVKRNLGVGCVVRDFARKDLESGKLFEFRFNKLIPKRQICVVKDSRAKTSIAARKLMDIMGV